MATRFCGNCGTEVDDDASFCPSCGRAIETAVDGSASMTAAIPAAPSWPPPGSEPSPEPAAAAPSADEVPREDAATPLPAQAAPPVEASPPPVQPITSPPATERGAQGGTQIDLPITWPVTMSGWLLGVGAVVAAFGFLIELFPGALGNGNAMNVVFLLLMLGAAATVFFSASVPAVPHLRLASLCLAFAALGIGLDRLGFGSAGVGTLLVLVGAGAACVGAVMLELGRDRPMSGPMGGGA